MVGSLEGWNAWSYDALLCIIKLYMYGKTLLHHIGVMASIRTKNLPRYSDESHWMNKATPICTSNALKLGNGLWSWKTRKIIWSSWFNLMHGKSHSSITWDLSWFINFVLTLQFWTNLLCYIMHINLSCSVI